MWFHPFIEKPIDHLKCFSYGFAEAQIDDGNSVTAGVTVPAVVRSENGDSRSLPDAHKSFPSSTP